MTQERGDFYDSVIEEPALAHLVAEYRGPAIKILDGHQELLGLVEPMKMRAVIDVISDHMQIINDILERRRGLLYMKLPNGKLFGEHIASRMAQQFNSDFKTGESAEAVKILRRLKSIDPRFVENIYVGLEEKDLAGLIKAMERNEIRKQKKTIKRE